jgi:hypothetical protein
MAISSQEEAGFQSKIPEGTSLPAIVETEYTVAEYDTVEPVSAFKRFAL